MRAVSLVLLAGMVAVGCAIETSGLVPADPGVPDGGRGIDARRPVDAGAPADAATADALAPPPSDAGTDSGPTPAPDSGPLPMPDAGPPPGSVGDPCTGTSDCQPGYECFRESWIPGGYCSRPCAGDGDCGPWGACVSFRGYQYCGRRCASGSECRLGYACSSGICVPS